MLILTHDACLRHDPGPLHPESPERLEWVMQGVEDFAARYEADIRAAPIASRKALLRVHETAYLDYLEQVFPAAGRVQLDPDTVLSPGTREAVYRGAGAAEQAVAEVISGRYRRVFCATRPPGHHAEPGRAMGFCLFNNIGVAVAAALAAGIERVAVVDFDVHHGNGTEAMFSGDGRVLLCSLFQHPLYPESGLHPADNCVFVPLDAGTGGPAYREAFSRRVEPALAAFAPQLICVSAGFDAHAGDPLAGLLLEDDDYAWVTSRIVASADVSAGGRIISVLEGGYRLDALRGAVHAHLQALAAPGHGAASSSG